MFAGSEPGAGAGKGGGAGGSIREAGGSMGKRAAALEDEYFRRQEVEQLQAIKENMAERSQDVSVKRLKHTVM
ncbi:uncharacterized protein DEA37_0003085 [Paragonimus westermani]|uniref:ATPase inhibitor, mitochondrial n=1 Tax=Paragonimus westermani TaxID=34504 RepID=A0A5J4NVC9_9TREM|nr:uncharacterized protein DEA37_0003085 [Paragonimus westermani]